MKRRVVGVIGRMVACAVVAVVLFACHDDSSPPADSSVSSSPPDGSASMAATDNAVAGSRTDNMASTPAQDKTDAGGIPIRKPSASTTNAAITGIAFVDSSVTGQGSKATLPAGTKIYPSGSTVSGTDGCPTTQYRTDGLIVAVIDYDGRPTSASLTLTEHLASGNTINRSPYYIDLNPGRTLQLLGPVFENGSFDMVFEYDYAQGAAQKRTASFELARSCSSR